jgi:Zn finger protein HypA/HybF involved in hydrogenase expression
MRETFEREKADTTIVLECEYCGHREQTRELVKKRCPICRGLMFEASDLDMDDEEWSGRHQSAA